jgi:hypothetical protein
VTQSPASGARFGFEGSNPGRSDISVSVSPDDLPSGMNPGQLRPECSPGRIRPGNEVRVARAAPVAECPTPFPSCQYTICAVCKKWTPRPPKRPRTRASGAPQIMQMKQPDWPPASHQNRHLRLQSASNKYVLKGHGFQPCRRMPQMTRALAPEVHSFHRLQRIVEARSEVLICRRRSQNDNRNFNRTTVLETFLSSSMIVLPVTIPTNSGRVMNPQISWFLPWDPPRSRLKDTEFHRSISITGVWTCKLP